MQIVVVRERCEPDRGKTLLFGAQSVFRQLLARIAANVHVAADTITRLAAHQVVNRHAQPLALHVPQRNVDRAQSALNDRAHEV